MNKRTKVSVWTFILVFILVGMVPVFTQAQDFEFYKKLLAEGRNLTKFEGDRSVRWTPDGKGYIVSKDKTFIKVNPATGEETSLFDDEKVIAAYNDVTGDDEKKLPFTRFEFIEDGAKIRFDKDNNTLVFFYDLNTHEMQKFKVRPPERGVRFAQYQEEFSTDYQYTAYIEDYNLFLRDLKKDKTTALTTDGHKDLRNGYPDWVYAEEFAQFYCFWWSPNSDKIAYMQFDESPVKKFPVLHDEKFDFELEMQSFPRVEKTIPSSDSSSWTSKQKNVSWWIPVSKPMSICITDAGPMTVKSLP